MAGTGTSPSAVPLYDLRLEPEDIRAVMEVLESGWLTLGPRTQAFEAAFAEHLGVRHAVPLSSCPGARPRPRRSPPPPRRPPPPPPPPASAGATRSSPPP